jgi:rhodanese-related sulfurtransferase
MKKIIFILVVIFLVSCTPKSDDENRERNGLLYSMSVEELHKMLINEDHILIDTRPYEEFIVSKVKNSNNFPIDLDRLNSEEDYKDQLYDDFIKIYPDKDQTYILYCRVGQKSKGLVNILLENGYTKVHHFGGVMNWKQKLLELLEIRVE